MSTLLRAGWWEDARCTRSSSKKSTTSWLVFTSQMPVCIILFTARARASVSVRVRARASVSVRVHVRARAHACLSVCLPLCVCAHTRVLCAHMRRRCVHDMRLHACAQGHARAMPSRRRGTAARKDRLCSLSKGTRVLVRSTYRNYGGERCRLSAIGADRRTRGSRSGREARACTFARRATPRPE